MTEQEEWRQVAGAPDYSVSDQGRVASDKSGAPVVIGGTLIGGYRRVRIYSGLSRASRGVHQLVAETFIGPKPSDEHEIRHLNGDSLDNRASNLAWGNRWENINDQLRHGTHVQARKTHCRQGHPYDDENTYTPPGRQARHCRACRRARKAGLAVAA